jgi:O-antigen ligase
MKTSDAGAMESRGGRGWRDAGPRAYVLLVVLWFLYLFAPHKLLQYFLPAARPLTWIPEFLLWICVIMWLRWPTPKRGYPAYTRFMALFIFGTAVAYLLGNSQLAIGIDRVMYQPYLLGLVTLTICDTPARARPIFGLYFGYFLWFGIWGLISLTTSPISAVQDTSTRVIVFWHRDYENRDAFGPLMVAGFAYSIYYLQANRAIGTRFRTVCGYLSMGLCAIGFITSFGRGAFIAFLAVGTSMWLNSARKMAIVFALLLSIGIAVLTAPQLVERYVGTMQSITQQGMHEGTGADRAALWTMAWRAFLSSPLVGVGTDNFGVGAGKLLSPGELAMGGYTPGRLWGRAVHSAPMTILAEYGLVGAIVAVLLVVDFFRTNRRTRLNATKASSQESGQDSGFPPGYVNAIALGLHSAFLAFCVSSIVYEILYTPLLWTVIVLNRMLYFASGASVPYEAKPAASLRPI